MNEQKFDKTMQMIVGTIESGGYSVHEQLECYLMSGDPAYITRKNNARRLIQALDKVQIRTYLNSYLKEN